MRAGSRLQMRGGANALLGRGSARPSALMGGMLPGEHLIPVHHMHQAVEDYKSLHGLHGRGLAPLHLPAEHVMHLMSHLDHPDGHVRGGFAFLPLIAGAAMPLIGEALKGLMGGFVGRAGSHLADKVAGSGLPRPVHHKGSHYVHIHGAGFLDFLKGAWGKIKQAVTSEPARKIGSFARNTLLEAIAKQIATHMAGGSSSTPAAPAAPEAPVAVPMVGGSGLGGIMPGIYGGEEGLRAKAARGGGRKRAQTYMKKPYKKSRVSGSGASPASEFLGSLY